VEELGATRADMQIFIRFFEKYFFNSYIDLIGPAQIINWAKFG
jgi:hypothetical protein